MRLGSYDLHCHSTYSDGIKTPYELIDQAKKRSLGGISITDHDTVSCYSRELFEYAKKNEIGLIPGVEFSSFFSDGNNQTPIHILGYGIDFSDPDILDFCHSHKKRREKRFLDILEKLNAGGYEIDEGIFSIDKMGSMGRPHIAAALIKMGYVANINEAFKLFLGDKAEFYVRSVTPTIEETISLIKLSKGKAVLAHPILIKSRKVLKKILETHAFDGIECFYGNFPRDKIQYLLNLAKEKKLSITGGSDYHGINRSYIYLGVSFTTIAYLEELLST